MNLAEFFEKFKTFLAEFDPGLDLHGLTTESHLWAEGYVSSFTMLNVVAFLEDETGRNIELNPDTLQNFFTIDRIYQAYVAPGEVRQ